MIVWHDVVAVAPNASQCVSATQTEILDIVNNRQIDDGYWLGTKSADVGRRYLAAHLATLALLRGKGIQSQEKVGDLSATYKTPQGILGSLGLTAYGAEYQRLCDLLPGVLGAVY